MKSRRGDRATGVTWLGHMMLNGLLAKRYGPAYAVLAVLAMLLLGLLLLVGRRSRINEANFEKIRLGMSSGDVERLLGRCPGRYSSGPEVTPLFVPLPDEELFSENGISDEEGRTWRAWISDDGMIVVCFDDNRGVIYKRFMEVYPRRLSLIESIEVFFRKLLH